MDSSTLAALSFVVVLAAIPLGTALGVSKVLGVSSRSTSGSRGKAKQFADPNVERQDDIESGLSRGYSQQQFFHAASDLGEFCERCEDLDESLAHYALNISDLAAEEVTKERVLVLAVLALTREIALGGDCLRLGDSERLAAFSAALAGAGSRYADLVGAGYMLRIAETDSDMIVLPLRLLLRWRSPDASTLRDRLISYARELALYSSEESVLSRRTASFEQLQSKLQAALSVEVAEEQIGSVSTPSLDSLNDYRLFELSPACTDEELCIAHCEKVRAWHPDRMQQLPLELQALAEERLKSLNRAYDGIVAARQR